MSLETNLTIISICLLILTIFATVVGIYFIRLLIALKGTTKAIGFKVFPLIKQARKIAKMTNHATKRIQSHIEMTTPLFHSIGKVCNFVKKFPHRLNNEVHDNTMNINFESKKNLDKIDHWAKWITLAILMIQKLRK